MNDGVLGVGTECYGQVSAEINIIKQINSDIDFLQYDHIVEGPIEVKSGILEILGCPNSSVQLAINLPAGSYVVRIYSSNLERVDGDEGDHYYKIEIWPEKRTTRQVLKRFN